MDFVLRWPSGTEWLAVVPMLSLLVFIHELGHFLAAIWMGVRVEEFGFGYPPRMLVLFERKGVKYTLNWLPFGGFVRLVGEEAGFDAPDSITSKKPWQRFVVFSGGVFMNLLLAVLIFIGLFLRGIPEPTGPILIQEVAPGSPAAVAGVVEGDVLVRIAGTEVNSFREVQEATAANVGRQTVVELKRDGALVRVTVVPRAPEDTPPNQGPLGVTITLAKIETVETHKVGFARAVLLGVERAFLLVGTMAEGLGQVVIGALSPAVPVPEGGVTGPIGIARLTGEVMRTGWLPFIDFTGFLSVNFALLNILPLPALDGGHLVFVLLEWIRRGKRIPPEREALVHLVGMVVLMGFVVVVSYLDIVRWLEGASVLPGG